MQDPKPTLQVLIVDDEALARERLVQLLGDLACGPGAVPVQVAGQAAAAPQALQWLAEQRADVLLLDVQMPGQDGTALARQLKTMAQPPLVVFVTAHGRHALQAFELEAVDFLTKPVRLERLREALMRVQRRLGASSAAPAAAAAAAAGEGTAAQATATAGPASPAADPVLVFSERGRVVRVPLREVLYLKAELKYVTLKTVRHSYVLDDPLADLERRLGPAVLRIHRSTVVALHAARGLQRAAGADDRWEVLVGDPPERLPVARRLSAAVREALAAGGV